VNKFLLFAALATSPLFSEARERAPLTEEMAKSIRQMHGIQDLRTELDARYIAYRDKGNFLISNANFFSQKEATSFCASKEGYSLTNGMVPGVISMMGAPFVGLEQRASVSSPVLGNGATGIAFWVQFDISKIPEGQELAEREKEILEMIREGDFFLGLTNGDGGSGSGPHRTSEVNARLKALGENSLSSPAFCVDKKLQAQELQH